MDGEEPFRRRYTTVHGNIPGIRDRVISTTKHRVSLAGLHSFPPHGPSSAVLVNPFGTAMIILLRTASVDHAPYLFHGSARDSFGGPLGAASPGSFWPCFCWTKSVFMTQDRGPPFQGFVCAFVVTQPVPLATRSGCGPRSCFLRPFNGHSHPASLSFVVNLYVR